MFLSDHEANAFWREREKDLRTEAAGLKTRKQNHDRRLLEKIGTLLIIIGLKLWNR